MSFASILASHELIRFLATQPVPQNHPPQNIDSLPTKNNTGASLEIALGKNSITDEDQDRTGSVEPSVHQDEINTTAQSTPEPSTPEASTPEQIANALNTTPNTNNNDKDSPNPGLPAQERVEIAATTPPSNTELNSNRSSPAATPAEATEPAPPESRYEDPDDFKPSSPGSTASKPAEAPTPTLPRNGIIPFILVAPAGSEPTKARPFKFVAGTATNAPATPTHRHKRRCTRKPFSLGPVAPTSSLTPGSGLAAGNGSQNALGSTSNPTTSANLSAPQALPAADDRTDVDSSPADPVAPALADEDGMDVDTVLSMMTMPGGFRGTTWCQFGVPSTRVGLK